MRIIHISSPEVNSMLARSQLTEKASAAVRAIVNNVRAKGDAALISYTAKFDKVQLSPETLPVSNEAWEELVSRCEPDLLAAMEKSAANIREFHSHQKAQSFRYERAGVSLGQRVLPLNRVGIYVPGGSAVYPSTVLMTATVAKCAGVPEVIMCTPPSRETGEISPLAAAAAKIAGVSRIYRAGGAQSIAAMAFGTETVPQVDKIAGPGNVYVALAKREVFGYVGIDSVAGPSEVLVIADESANPAFIAADLLSQAEHDPMAASICLTTSKGLAGRIQAEVFRQTETLEKKEIIEKSLEANGYIVVCDSLAQAVELSDMVAPEHLELAVENPEELLALVKNAGAVFLGHYTPEPMGDYFAGPSHVLPTSGTARFFSPLNLDDFLKKTSVIAYSKEAVLRDGADVIALAEAEGLTAHANSVRLRLAENNAYRKEEG